MAKRSGRLGICFETTVHAIDGSVLVRLPDDASERLPSRGQVAVHGTLNDHAFRTVIEPDGAFGHWMKVDEKLRKAPA